MAGLMFIKKKITGKFKHFLVKRLLHLPLDFLK